MKITLSTGLWLFALAQLAGSQVNMLQEPLEDIYQQAARENRHLLIAFLGDGWSVSSGLLQKSWFESERFKSFAEKRLLFCPIFARQVSSLEKSERSRLKALAHHFDIREYPTIILVAPDGTEILRHGYRDDPIDKYLALLKAVLPDP